MVGLGNEQPITYLDKCFKLVKNIFLYRIELNDIYEWKKITPDVIFTRVRYKEIFLNTFIWKVGEMTQKNDLLEWEKYDRKERTGREVNKKLNKQFMREKWTW